MVVYLDKESTRFDSIFRNVLDEIEATCRSKGFMQSRRRKRIRKILIYFLEQWLGGTIVSFCMSFNHWWKDRKGFSWYLKSIMLISKRWNWGLKWFVKPFLLYNLIRRAFFNGLVRGARDWIRYRVSVVSTGSQGLREGVRGYKS